jgi:predicted O-methyltransferase YrrM
MPPGRAAAVELQDYKSVYLYAGMAEWAESTDFMVSDAVVMIKALLSGIDFVLVDLWKELYVPCGEAGD